jgi:hypothetical protein
MHWFYWVMVGIWVINPILHILMIGKARSPYSKGDAMTALVFSSFFIYMIFRIEGVI